MSLRRRFGGVAHPYRIATALVLLIIISTSPSGVFASATVEPHYTHCCLPRGAGHGPIPTSISGITDEYEIVIVNNRNVSMTGVVVYFPAGFAFVNASVGGGGWVTAILRDQSGIPAAISWNGSRILPGANATFMLTLHNPTVGLQLSGVYDFLVAQLYVNALPDGSRDPVEIIQPIRLFGIDSSALAFASIAIVFVLIALQLVLPRRKL